MFLSDSELIKELTGGAPIVEGLALDESDPFGLDSPVQPCSVDLTIGDIFEPGVEKGKPGGADSPREDAVLRPGQTAVITTREKCKLPSNFAAIGFPPNSVSSQGILMTNPGHVDPGYEGPMMFTVINMGSEDYLLVKGRKIVTLLIFKLDPGATKNLKERGVLATTANVETLLAKLSDDFLNVERRVREAAATEEQKTRRTSLWAPIIAGLVATLLLSYGLIESVRGEVSDLKADASAFGDTRQLEKEVDELQRELARIDPSTLLRARKE